MGYCQNCGKPLNIGETCDCLLPGTGAKQEPPVMQGQACQPVKTFTPEKKKSKSRIFYYLSPISLVIGIIGCICFYNNDYTFGSALVREVRVAFDGEAYVKMIENLWFAVFIVSLILIFASVAFLIIGLVKFHKHKKVRD